MNKDIILCAKKYIEQYYMAIDHLEKIASCTHCNYHSLRHNFVKKMGLTLGQYLTKIRCKKARELLLETDWKLFKVANKVGFHDDKYFIKVFEKQFGISPNQYRLTMYN